MAQARRDWNVLRVVVAREMKRLKNESLPRKVEALRTVCRPGDAEILTGYCYDADRVKRIDTFRHALVHEEIVKSPSDVIDDVEFMERTQVYLSLLVTHRHGLTLGPDAMSTALA